MNYINQPVHQSVKYEGYGSRGIFQEAVVTHFNVLSHRLLIDIEENHEKQSLATVWSKILNKDLSNASKVLPATLRFKLYIQYSVIMTIAPWTKVLEKLIVAQLAKKFSAFSEPKA